MSRTVNIECPLTGERRKVLADPWDQPTVADVEDGDDDCEGWGQLAVAVVVPNPLRVIVQAQREALLAQVPKAEHDRVLPAIEKQFPLPAELVRVTWTAADLSPDAVRAVFEALATAGLAFDVTALGDEDE